MKILLKQVILILIYFRINMLKYLLIINFNTYIYFLANNCIWLILDILQTQMPSINDLMIKVIEKEISHIDEFKLTVIVSMFRMISKVCF